jgi:hypothetical protein
VRCGGASHSHGKPPKRRANVASLDESLLRHLLLTPPPGFVAERNARVKALRAAGRREEAALLASVRRPSWTDWALNRAADDHPESVAAFAAAAEAMREAQAAAVEGRSADVGAALRALRDRTTDLVKLASTELRGAGRDADVADLTERVVAVAADAMTSERLRTGVLQPDDDAVDAIRGLPDSTAASAGRRDASSPDPAGGPRRSGTRSRRADGPTTDDAIRRRGERAAEHAAEQAVERRRTMRELAESERAQRTAAHELARAERAVVEAEAKRASASEAVDRAQRDLAESETRLAAAVERRVNLAHDVDAAERRAAALRGQLARLADD